MPRLPINYTNTHFYKIVCKDTSITDCYVGHTTDFKSRKTKHKHCCMNENNKKYYIYVYKFMRDNGGV
jgi:predicted GIY-YIG superfamily endonuclease